MRLATLSNGSRDGRLVIVSADQARAVEANAADTLLEALENWRDCEAALRAQASALESGTVGQSFPLSKAGLLAPLPRAPQWLDGSAFRTHSELVAKAWRLPSSFDDHVPLMYQGASDDLLPAYGPSCLPDESHEIDLEAEVAVIVDEVPMGIGAQAALEHVRLVTLANDVSLRAFGAREQKAGFGFLQAKPSTLFSPCAVTPDELGSLWQSGRLCTAITVRINGAWIGSPNASHMTFSFGELIAHAAKTRRLSAGTVIGSGTVSDPDRRQGSATILERRAIEQVENGKARTPYLKFGDRVEIDALDGRGHSIFGSIDHRIVRSA